MSEFKEISIQISTSFPTCPYCKDTQNNWKNTDSGVEEVKIPENSKIFECKNCGKRFKYTSETKRTCETNGLSCIPNEKEKYKDGSFRCLVCDEIMLLMAGRYPLRYMRWS